MKVKIESYKKHEGTGKIKGFASISMMVEGFPLTINGIKVVQKDDGGIFYSMPDKEYTNKEGEKKFSPHCAFFSREGSTAFNAAVHDGFKEYFKNQSAPQPVQAAPKKVVVDDDCPF